MAKKLDLDKLISTDITGSTRPRPAQHVPTPPQRAERAEEPSVSHETTESVEQPKQAVLKPKKARKAIQKPEIEWQRTSMMLPMGLSAEIDIAVGKARVLTGKRGNDLNKSKLIAAAIRLAMQDLEQNGLNSATLAEISNI